MTESKDIVLAQDNALTILLADPDKLKEFPVDTVERLFRLDQEIKDRAAKQAFIQAFVRVQQNMEPVYKRGQNTNTRSSYVLLDDVCTMLNPLLLENGFAVSVSTRESPQDNMTRFVLMVRHEGGHVEEHTMDAAIDSHGPKGTQVKTMLQGMGSSYTYCRRFLLVQVFGVIATNDDDGNAAKETSSDADRITHDQAEEIHRLMKQTDTEPKRLLDIMGAQKVEELKASQLNFVLSKLHRKLKDQAEVPADQVMDTSNDEAPY